MKLKNKSAALIMIILSFWMMGESSLVTLGSPRIAMFIYFLGGIAVARVIDN